MPEASKKKPKVKYGRRFAGLDEIDGPKSLVKY